MFSSNFIIAQYVPFVLMWRRLLYIGFESNALRKLIFLGATAEKNSA